MNRAKKMGICAALVLMAVSGVMTAAANGNSGIENMKGLSYEMKTYAIDHREWEQL